MARRETRASPAGRDQLEARILRALATTLRARDFIVDRVAPTVTMNLSGTRTASGAFSGSATVDADVTDPALSAAGQRGATLIVEAGYSEAEVSISTIKGDPEDLVRLDWSHEWRP